MKGDSKQPGHHKQVGEVKRKPEVRKKPEHRSLEAAIHTQDRKISRTSSGAEFTTTDKLNTKAMPAQDPFSPHSHLELQDLIHVSLLEA